jgi:uncharacterized protein YxeA
MKKLIIILVGVAIAFAGYKLQTANSNFVRTGQVNKYTAICNNKATTTGMIQDQYKQKKGTYTYYYDYKVDEKEYTLTQTGRSEPTLEMMVAEINYDSTNPSKATLGDPCALKESSSKGDGNQILFYLGYAMMVIGGLSAYFTFRGLIRGGKKA